MAITEIPFGQYSDSLGSLMMAGSSHLRASWQNSFFLPADQKVSCNLVIGPGALSNEQTVTTFNPATYVAAGQASLLPSSGTPFLPAGQTAYPVAGGLIPVVGSVTGVGQAYIDSSGNVQCVSVASTSTPFPGGSIALCYVIVDACGRIQGLLDQRTSFLSSIPSFGAGTEVISAPTLRASWAANYSVPRTFSLSKDIPFDLALPSSQFTLGGGAVVISGNTITTPATVFSTATNAAANGWKSLFVNAITQIFVSPSTGQVSTQIPATSGVFPANSLAICEVTTDATGQIRSIVEFRPSFI